MRNYGEITIDGKKVGIKFGMPAMQLISPIIMGKNEGDAYGVVDLAKVLHAGYKNNCIVKEVSETLTFEDFMDYVEEKGISANPNELTGIMTVFSESSVVKDLAQRGAEREGEQKKSQSLSAGPST